MSSARPGKSPTAHSIGTPLPPYRRNLFSYLEYNLNVSLLQVTIIRNLAVSSVACVFV